MLSFQFSCFLMLTNKSNLKERKKWGFRFLPRGKLWDGKDGGIRVERVGWHAALPWQPRYMEMTELDLTPCAWLSEHQLSWVSCPAGNASCSAAFHARGAGRTQCLECPHWVKKVTRPSVFRATHFAQGKNETSLILQSMVTKISAVSVTYDRTEVLELESPEGGSSMGQSVGSWVMPRAGTELSSDDSWKFH